MSNLKNKLYFNSIKYNVLDIINFGDSDWFERIK